MTSNPYFTLRPDLIKWSNLLTHPSEFTRIDEQLRLKQIELASFSDAVEGWTKIAAQENLEHQRLIYSMRCYLSITCQNIFGASMLSKNEFQSLKNSYIDRENILKPGDQDYATLNRLSYYEYWLILNMTSDKHNTEQLYRKILGKIIESIDSTVLYSVKQNMIDTIIQKCFFTVE